MTWDGNYRLKHITSGKYLRGVETRSWEVDGQNKSEYKLKLSFDLDECSLF